MMKLIFNLILLLLPLQVFGYSFAVDGIYYSITNSQKKYVGVTYKDRNFASYSGAVSVPSTVSYNNVTYSVTSISTNAFYNSSELTSVELPSTLTSIGANAFENCSKLSEVVVPSSVTLIDTYAFYNCSSLESIALSSSLNTIGEYAFRYCKKLKSVTIPSSTTSIGVYAFSNCSALTNMNVEEGNVVYDSRSECNGIIATSINSLLFACKTTTIPEGVEIISSTAFNGLKELTSISLPTSVKALSDFAFAGTGIKSLNIPETVTFIGNDVFENCSSLESLTLPHNITAIPNEMCWNCSKLKTIEIPEGVKTIGTSAFYGCSSLESVVIPSTVSVYGISSRAFYNCTSLKDVYLKKTGTPIQISWVDIWGVKTSDATLHVRRSNFDLYSDAYVWKDFGNIVKLPALLGDANDDEMVNAMDAIAIITAYTNGNAESIDLEVGDVNKDGTINAMDAIEIINIYINNN